MEPYISLNEFKNIYITQQKDYHLFDVLSEDSFENEHISGAKSLCVYEMKFLDKIKEYKVKKDSLVVLYGNSDETFEAKLAYEKLKANGYTNVLILQEGITGWKAAKGKVVTKKDKSEMKTLKSFGNTTLKLDNSLSNLIWRGKNIVSTHYGTIDFDTGFINIKQGKIVGGKVALQMKTIKDQDLQDEKWKKMLETHLKSDDFFYVEKYPQAIYEITSIKLLSCFEDRYFDYCFEGNMLIKGKSRKITCYPKVEILDNGSVHMWISMVVDRTKWGIFYGSKRFFAKLGKHFVYDNIDLDLNLIFK